MHRCALQGEAGFSRRYTSLELQHFLQSHGQKEYTYGAFRNCKLQSRRKGVVPQASPNRGDPVPAVTVQGLAPTFEAGRLLLGRSWIEAQPESRLCELREMFPEEALGLGWCEDYCKALDLLWDKAQTC
jgi:hypothetical protein